MPTPQTPESAQSPETVPGPGPRTVAVQMRTAPKIWPFLLAGVIVGAVVALVVTWISHASLVADSPDGTTEHSFGSTFGFMFMIFAVVGLGVASLIFLGVDKAGRRRAHNMDMVVEPVTDDPDEENRA
jgi:hypothetical protein